MKYMYRILLLLLINPALYAQQGSALQFDGVDDVIDCGNHAALDITGTNLTLEARIIFNGTGTIISSEQSNAAGFVLRQDADGKLSFFIGSSGSWFGTSTATTAISNGVLYHIAATYDGVNLKIYIDGVEAASTPTTAAITSTSNNVFIGDWYNGGRNINATIDDVRIWNITRTSAAISANMSTDLTLPQTGLIAYYTFNQGTANDNNSGETTLQDATTNNHDGTLNNFALTGVNSNWVSIGPTPVPTTTYPTQIYTGDDKDLDDLQVTGTAIQWYATASGGTTLPSSTLLTDDTTYYASQTLGGLESTTRLAVTVNRISDNTQTYNSGDTVANLTNTPSTGATATWYTTASGGTALIGTEALSAGTYYVEEITPETTETLGSGFSFSTGLAIQADGKIVIADRNNNAIKRMNADGTSIETLGSGFSLPGGVAVQSDGKIVIADGINNAIKRMNADGSGIETLGSGFSWANGVAIQADGKILVSDSDNWAVKRMNADGTGIEVLGSGFVSPHGIAVQADGKIVIADTNNNVIKRMNVDGSGIETLGSGFSFPNGVAIQADGKILIADTINNLIKRMNADGTNIETISSGFNQPRGIVLQADGKILVADSGNNAIKRITEAYTSNRVAVVVEEQVTAAPTTIYATQIYTGDDKDVDDLQVTGTAIQWYAAASGGSALPSTTLLTDATTYYASQTLNSLESTARLAITVNRISDNTQEFTTGETVADLVSTPSTGATATWYTTASGGTALTGTEALSVGTYYVEEVTQASVETLGSGFNEPTGVAAQVDGKILIADTYNNAIKRMNADGTGIETLGSGFNEPTGVAAQADGKIWIADHINGAVKRMNADGSGIVSLGSGFSSPHGIAIQSDGKILIADSGNNSIMRINADGTGIETVNSSFDGPYAVAVQTDGKIVIANTFDHTIKRMNADGTGVETLGSGFSYPVGVTVQTDGKILIADSGNGAIKRMNADGTGIVSVTNSINGSENVAIQADGKILVVDRSNNVIERITEAYTSNRVPVILSEILGIDEVDFNMALQVYPNPVHDKLHITTKNGLLIEHITITDALGRIVLTTQSQDILNLSQISSGVLLLNIKTNKGTVIKRIIKR